MKKLWPDADAALDGLVKDGMLLAIGGFGVCGVPEALIEAVERIGARGLTVASNNAGINNAGLARLLVTRQILKMIASYVGECGEFEVEFCPQGTLAERMRAGGTGIPGFYVRTGVGTVVAEGKEHKKFDGETYILERGIRADVALVKARKGDTHGNLVYRRSAQNFNPGAAMSGKVTVAEIEILVNAGEWEPEHIRRVVVLMEHSAPGGVAKLLRSCTLPLTGKGLVDRVITDLCMLDVTSRGFELVELAPGSTEEQVRVATEAEISIVAERVN